MSWRFFAGRLVGLVVILWALVTIVFLVGSVIPSDPARREDVARVLGAFGDSDCPHHLDESIGVRLRGGDISLAEVVRALDAEGIEVAHLQVHEPSLDDVFLAKTGRTLEGSHDDEEAEDGEDAPEQRPAPATA